MNNVALNPTQLHLLKMFSFAKTDDTLFEIKKALSAYFAQKVEDDMDQLWEQGLWDQEKNENILKEHLRTPYVGQSLHQGKYTLCVSNDIIEEYEEILSQKKPKDYENLLLTICGCNCLIGCLRIKHNTIYYETIFKD